MMTIAPQDKRKQMERKLLDLAFEAIKLSVTSALLLSTLIVVALWPIIEHVRLLSWFGVMALIQALNIYLVRRYKSARNVESELHKWRAGLVASGVAAGLCWSSTVISFSSSAFEPVTVLLMIALAGVAAYASVAMAIVPSFAIVFLTCTLLPLAIWLFSFMEYANISMSLFILTYLGVMLTLSRRIYDTVCSLTCVTEENQGLRTEQQESNWRMQRLFESAPGFFYTACMTPDGKSSMPFVSAGIHELLDLASAEVASSMAPLFALIHAEDIEGIVNAREASRTNLSPFYIEFRINHRLKGERWIELHSLPKRKSDGSTYWHGFMHDITKRKQAESELRTSEARMRLFFEHQVVGMAITSPEKGWLQVNDRLCDMLGYTHDELCRLSWAELTHPCDLTADMAQFERLLNGEIDSYMLEKRFVRKDGGIVHTNLGIGCVRREDCSVDYVLAVLDDITGRKLAQQQSEMLDAAINHSFMAIYLIDTNMRFHYVNTAACRSLGYSREELLGMNVFDIDPLITQEQILNWGALFATGAKLPPMESVHRARDGREFPVEISSSLIDYHGEKFSISVAHDITERKTMETALLDREKMLQEAQRIAHVGSWEMDMVNDKLVWSNEIFSIWEIDKTKFKANLAAFLETIHPDDRERVSQAYNDAVINHTLYEVEHRLLFPDGRVKHILERGEPQRDAQGKPVRFIGTAQDITERKLAQQQQELLDTAISHSSDAIFLIGKNAGFYYVNAAACRRLGYSREELLDMRVFDIDPLITQERLLERTALLETGVKLSPMESLHRARDGREFPVEVSTSMLVHNGEKFVLSVVRDITERKKNEAVLEERFHRITELNRHLEQSAHELEEQAVELEMSKEQLQQTEAWYRSILHSAPDGMLIVDARGIIMQVNAQLEAMFGYYGGELPGTSIEVLVPEAARISHVEKRNGFISCGNKEHRIAGASKDLLGRRKDGSVFPVDVSLSRLPDLDGRVGAICAAVRDVTERQKADVARESALSEALRLAQLRSSFLAQMSHELRTPLNGILGYTQNLLRGEALVESQRSGLNIIQHSGEHLLTLINGILDHAAIEAGKFDLIQGDIELESFLSTLIGIIRVRAEQKSVAFSCEVGDDLPAMVSGDAQRLRQVLLNLLSNAVKFTDKGQVILRITYSASSRMRFEVQDSGVGIAADQLDNIFLPFEQVGETSRRAGGNGLGLAISRKLVELMGGNIKVESQPGKGSTFSFEIEMATVQSATAKVNAAALSERATTRGLPLASTLMAPPPQELDALHALALRGNMRDIALQATRLTELDPLYTPFAEHLRLLAKGFQTKALLGFIAQYRDEDKKLS